MIILASQSPRRKEILTEILGDIPFETIPSSFQERNIQEKDCHKLCLEEALGKANVLAKEYPTAYIIASDTMVSYKGQQLGKPKDEKDVYRMLRLLSGNTHEIITAYVIQQGMNILKKKICTATLFIEKMADIEIQEYLDTGSPLDKAGAYGVQDTDFINSKIVSGDKYTIMGLPKDDLEADLKELKII
ncbi:MAG: nucleoside triphosphate pyrophosphatase [Bacilli bacterium]|jgi:septum formation protein